MLLRDATSKKEVEKALEDGDEELAEDIEDQLDESRRWWARSYHNYVNDDHDPVDFRNDIADRPAFIDAVVRDSPTEYDLGHIPREDVEAGIRWAATHSVSRGRGGGRQWGPFYVDETTDHFAFPVDRELSAQFPEHELPKYGRYIPEDLAEAFWDSLEPSVNWQDTTEVVDNTGWMDGDRIFVVANEDEFVEWCRDLVAEYIQKQVKKDPKTAIAVFMKGVSYQNGRLGEKLQQADLPEEELLDFTTKWFEGEHEREEVVATLKDYFTTIESGVDEPREVIQEWSQSDLRTMGILKGSLYENTPLRLLKLHPADLRLEGTLMRHCVGEKGMGYVKALSEGEIEIWSLRDRANKPRFTLEIDKGTWDRAETPGITGADVVRARAINQLKGKANRLAGFADTRAEVVKFPDEIVFWVHVLRQLGVDPDEVEDLTDTRPMLPNRREACTGFDLPYRARWR